MLATWNDNASPSTVWIKYVTAVVLDIAARGKTCFTLPRSIQQSCDHRLHQVLMCFDCTSFIGVRRQQDAYRLQLLHGFMNLGLQRGSSFLGTHAADLPPHEMFAWPLLLPFCRALLSIAALWLRVRLTGTLRWMLLDTLGRGTAQKYMTKEPTGNSAP